MIPTINVTFINNYLVIASSAKRSMAKSNTILYR